MIIPNISTGSGAPPVRHVSDDAPAVVVQNSTPAPFQQPSPAQLKNAVDSINKAMLQSNHSLAFSVDPNTKTLVVKMTDTATGELISQFPSEAVLAIASSIDQFLGQHQAQSGLLLKQKA